MAGDLSVDTSLNPETANIVEIKLIKAQFCWGDLAGRNTKGFPSADHLERPQLASLHQVGRENVSKALQDYKRMLEGISLEFFSNAMMDAYALKRQNWPTKRQTDLRAPKGESGARSPNPKHWFPEEMKSV